MATLQQVITLPTPAPSTTPPSFVPASPMRPRSINNAPDDVEMAVDSDPRPTTLENGARFGSGPQRGDTRIVTIVYGQGQESILSVFAEVLGQPSRLRTGFGDITRADEGAVVGILASRAAADLASRDSGLVVAINAHCVDLGGMPPDPVLSAKCDYEFLYTQTPFFRRDLARFVSFTLGQINHHETLMAKQRTFMISTTFPDVRAALPNIDILTVGADAVELRVDLLREPLPDGSFAAVPSLSYVGEQVMLLRQRTELPLIFTTRCTRENGKFPMDDPELYYRYLYRAVQWGVEYIDVEVWLPEAIRRRLHEQKGNSRIMSAFHDFSGGFRWSSDHARQVFVESSRLADVVKMIAIINDHNENIELEYFRLKMRAECPGAPPFSGLNMGETGQFSRTLNRVFTPITHPLLPLIAAPGQMSAAEINSALAMLGQLPKKNIYGISGPASRSAVPQAPFYEKCFNELGLPHQFAVVERPLLAQRAGTASHPAAHARQPPSTDGVRFVCSGAAPGAGTGSSGIEAWCNQKNFGGAYLTPPVSYQALVTGSAFFQSLNGGTGPVLTEAARLIGMVDTIVVRPGSAAPSPASDPSSPGSQTPQLSNGGTTEYGGGGRGDVLPPGTTLVFDNASWRGILSTLTRDLAPSAYFGRSAVVLASSADDAVSAVFALRELRIGKLFTVGFKMPAALSRGLDVEPFNSLESLQRAAARAGAVAGGGGGDIDDAGAPFVVVSALGHEKANLVGMLVRLFGSSSSSQQQQPPKQRRRVFLDLADGAGSTPPRKTNPAVVAEQSGFVAYGSADTAAFTTVETLRLLVGQNVPYSFVRLASGRAPY